MARARRQARAPAGTGCRRTSGRWRRRCGARPAARRSGRPARACTGSWCEPGRAAAATNHERLAAQHSEREGGALAVVRLRQAHVLAALAPDREERAALRTGDARDGAAVDNVERGLQRPAKHVEQARERVRGHHPVAAWRVMFWRARQRRTGRPAATAARGAPRRRRRALWRESACFARATTRPTLRGLLGSVLVVQLHHVVGRHLDPAGLLHVVHCARWVAAGGAANTHG